MDASSLPHLCSHPHPLHLILTTTSSLSHIAPIPDPSFPISHVSAAIAARQAGSKGGKQRRRSGRQRALYPTSMTAALRRAFVWMRPAANQFLLADCQRCGGRLSSLPVVSSSPLLSVPQSSAFHIGRPLQRIRRVLKEDPTRPLRSYNDTEYLTYADRIVFQHPTDSPPSPPPPPPSSVDPQQSAALTAPDRLSVSRSLSPTPPSLSPASSSSVPSRRAALYAARAVREAAEEMRSSWYASGDSARVRRWQREQKKRRTRADRRRRKFAETQGEERAQRYREQQAAKAQAEEDVPAEHAS